MDSAESGVEITIDGHATLAYLSPAESQFADINIIGGDFIKQVPSRLDVSHIDENVPQVQLTHKIMSKGKVSSMDEDQESEV